MEVLTNTLESEEHALLLLLNLEIHKKVYVMNALTNKLLEIGYLIFISLH